MSDPAELPIPTLTNSVQPLAQLAAGGKWRLELPHDVPWHRFIWITRGTGSVMLNGRVRAMSGSVAMYIPANTLHAIQMPTGTFGTVLSLPDDQGIPFPDGPRFVRVTDVKIQQQVNGLFDNLIFEMEHEAHSAEVARAAHAALFGVWLDRHRMAQDLSKPKASARLMNAFCTALVDRFPTGETAGDYARRLNVTPTHLSRCCNTAIGLPASLLVQYRVQHEARRLLVDTDVAINKIAEGLGYSSAAYFTRSFQHHAKMPPSEFRATQGLPAPASAQTPPNKGPRISVNFGRS